MGSRDKEHISKVSKSMSACSLYVKANERGHIMTTGIILTIRWNLYFVFVCMFVCLSYIQTDALL
jgi:hypothetical protein